MTRIWSIGPPSHHCPVKNQIKSIPGSYPFFAVCRSNRYTIKLASKPCPETIFGSVWEELVYIGDNPAKDFVNLNGVGAKTIRVLIGMHADMHALLAHDA